MYLNLTLVKEARLIIFGSLLITFEVSSILEQLEYRR